MTAELNPDILALPWRVGGLAGLVVLAEPAGRVQTGPDGGDDGLGGDRGAGGGGAQREPVRASGGLGCEPVNPRPPGGGGAGR